MLASSMAQQGKTAEAQKVIERIRSNHPDLTLEKLLGGMPFTDPLHVEHLREGLVKAGWRDTTGKAGV